MTSRTVLRLLPLLVLVPTFTSADPIRIHPDTPRYFEWRGKPTVLVASGEHYGAVINLDFDFELYLQTLEADGLNHTRIFLGSYVEWPGAFNIENNTLAPAPERFIAPWARSDTPGYPLGGNKFDLDRWNPDFFERMHRFMEAADRHGIVVEAVLFFAGPGWDYMPHNPKNNVNETDDVGGIRYTTLDNGNLLKRQEDFTRKLVKELNRYDNLILNVCNEPWFFNQDRPGLVAQPPPATKAWLGRIASWIRDEEGSLPKRHVISVDLSNQGTVILNSDLATHFRHIDGFNFHYDANAASLTLNPHVPRYLSFNETGFNGSSDQLYRTQGWNYLIAGGAVYSHLDFSFTVGNETGNAKNSFKPNSYSGGGSPELRKRLAILLEFMKSIPFERMSRDDGVVAGGADNWVALAAPGEAYAIWFPGHGEIRPGLILPAGRYRAEWVDTLTGEVTTESFEASSWLTEIVGNRTGGGIALRIYSMDTDKTSSEVASPLETAN